MDFYRILVQGVTNIGLRKPIVDGGYKELLEAAKYGDIRPGDLIKLQIGGSKEDNVLYRGINTHGGPGQAGIPTPMFSPTTPQNEEIINTFNAGSFPDWEKTGHITPEEWNKLVEEAKAS